MLEISCTCTCAVERDFDRALALREKAFAKKWDRVTAIQKENMRLKERIMDLERALQSTQFQLKILKGCSHGA